MGRYCAGDEGQLMDSAELTSNEAPYSSPLLCSSYSVFFNWIVLMLNAAGDVSLDFARTQVIKQNFGLLG